jgi:Domain of unknown function (DUF4136)
LSTGVMGAEAVARHFVHPRLQQGDAHATTLLSNTGIFVMRASLLALLVLLQPVAAHAATIKVDVSRFHLLAPPAPALAGTSITVEPAAAPAAGDLAAPPQPPSLQFGVLAAAANAELARAGFKPMAAGQPADHVARISLTGTSELVRKRSPISIGVGGGTGGWNGGVGGGVSFPLGGGTRTVTAAQMTMQIRRVRDNSVLWEGRASAIAPGADPLSAAPVLLQALLKGFPGGNGQSETIKVKTAP